jgi:hypothetical protein
MSPRLYRALIAVVLLAAAPAFAQVPGAPGPAPAPPRAQIKAQALANVANVNDASDREDMAGDQDEDAIHAGVLSALGALGVLRIDGKGRGFAGGAGLAISHGNFEFEIMMLKSDVVGGYLGLRYRLGTGMYRPYIAIGAPGFAFDHDEPGPADMPMTTQRLSIGARAAAGIELTINRHVSVLGDLGYEHFFFLDDDPYDADVFVPTLGVIGRM